jgi:hypothetical protein
LIGASRASSRSPLVARAWHRAQPCQIVGPRHARPLSGGCAWLRPRRGAANLTRLARDARGLAGRDGGTGALIEPRTIDRREPRPCLMDHSPDTVVSPGAGEIITPRTQKFGWFRSEEQFGDAAERDGHPGRGGRDAEVRHAVKSLGAFHVPSVVYRRDRQALPSESAADANMQVCHRSARPGV